MFNNSPIKVIMSVNTEQDENPKKPLIGSKSIRDVKLKPKRVKLDSFTTYKLDLYLHFGWYCIN